MAQRPQRQRTSRKLYQGIVASSGQRELLGRTGRRASLADRLSWRLLSCTRPEAERRGDHTLQPEGHSAEAISHALEQSSVGIARADSRRFEQGRLGEAIQSKQARNFASTRHHEDSYTIRYCSDRGSGSNIKQGDFSFYEPAIRISS